MEEDDESAALAAALRSPAQRSTEAFESTQPIINDADTGMDPVSEEAHLREIWRELGVGTSGYINVDELARVCDHIGMDEMSDEVNNTATYMPSVLYRLIVIAQELAHLFDKLDVDQDGLVSFSEFLRGLFQHGNTPAATPISTQRYSI